MIEAERVALRRRYARERDKRLRPDGNDQYLELKGQFSQLLEDPYTPRTERDPRRDHVTVAFVGGGFAGLVTGARLREAGLRDVRIVEKGGGFGGTWYWNRFPGAQCDTSAMIYMPLLNLSSRRGPGTADRRCRPGRGRRARPAPHARRRASCTAASTAVPRGRGPCWR